MRTNPFLLFTVSEIKEPSATKLGGTHEGKLNKDMYMCELKSKKFDGSNGKPFYIVLKKIA